MASSDTVDLAALSLLDTPHLLAFDMVVVGADEQHDKPRLLAVVLGCERCCVSGISGPCSCCCLD